MLINCNLTGIAYGSCMNIWELIIDADLFIMNCKAWQSCASDNI